MLLSSYKHGILCVTVDTSIIIKQKEYLRPQHWNSKYWHWENFKWLIFPKPSVQISKPLEEFSHGKKEAYFIFIPSLLIPNWREAQPVPTVPSEEEPDQSAGYS